MYSLAVAMMSRDYYVPRKILGLRPYTVIAKNDFLLTERDCGVTIRYRGRSSAAVGGLSVYCIA